MEYRRLGSTGLKCSVLAMGTMTFGRQTDVEQAKELLKFLHAKGVNFIDSAEMYGRGARPAQTVVARQLAGP